ncbi:MarR family transcriptional regulator [Pseudodesulfovibrio sp.]|uniref:MarR family winged helix-turn-helix transcriptional regulator n=1 Tax=Pseudodesulfovibrio sp. TaxID=2035812 RepID=UPI0026197B24|nr:MarR family transcriptional regulator [Pseudodesulfovibrio sp.]MDD3313261.1 MarR family transcriptional regulator [Pseudodesulfovibrio sp.]
MPRCSEHLHCCLYFTANALARNIGKLADAAFQEIGLSPSHAFMLQLVNEQPGITQKELAEYLSLAPSTLTRFADRLVYRGYVERDQKGKVVRIYPTSEGKALKQPIEKAWTRLYKDYSAILGEQPGIALTRLIDQANRHLEDLG